MKKIVLFLLSTLMFFGVAWIASASIFGWSSTQIPYCNDWDKCWLEEWVDQIKNANIQGIYTDWTASEYVQRIIVYLLTFLRLAAVILIIYSWFNMLTSNWDEDKFGKSKTMLIYSVIWLVIIYLAWPITNFIIDVFVKS